MPDNNLGNNPPQFSVAEYERKTDGDHCRFCNQSIVGSYYRVNNAMACASCADRAKREVLTDSHAAFTRALLLGIVAAIVGMALYATFEIMSGITIGYASLAVGFIIGKAIKIGSKGVGGRRYQIAAALLTYAAVSTAAIPVAFSQLHKQQVEHEQVQISQSQKSDKPSTAAQAQSAADHPSTSTQPSEPEQPKPAKPKMGLGTVLGILIVIGLASPFLELQNPVFGLIGLVILFVGIRIAWRMTSGSSVQIDGPHNNPASVSG